MFGLSSAFEPPPFCVLSLQLLDRCWGQGHVSALMEAKLPGQQPQHPSRRCLPPACHRYLPLATVQSYLPKDLWWTDRSGEWTWCSSWRTWRLRWWRRPSSRRWRAEMRSGCWGSLERTQLMIPISKFPDKCKGKWPSLYSPQPWIGTWLADRPVLTLLSMNWRGQQMHHGLSPHDSLTSLKQPRATSLLKKKTKLTVTAHILFNN